MLRLMLSSSEFLDWVPNGEQVKLLTVADISEVFNGQKGQQTLKYE